MRTSHLIIMGGFFALVLSVVTAPTKQRSALKALISAEQNPAARLANETQESLRQQREAFDVSSPEIPVAVTAVRNLNTDNWIENMEFEVENRSRRSVYYVLLVVKFPDVPKSTDVDGKPRGLVTTVRYGRSDFSVHEGELAGPRDRPLRSHRKVMLRLDRPHCEGLRHYLASHALSESVIRRVRVRIDEISFGDGSGYILGNAPFSPSPSSERAVQA